MNNSNPPDASPDVRDVLMPSIPEAEQPFALPPAREGHRFVSPWGARNTRGLGDVLRWKMKRDRPLATLKRTTPPHIPVESDPVGAWDSNAPGARVQWLGHASVLIELDGLTVLIDPVFGGVGPGLGRAVPAPRLPDALPRVDVVLLSHGHYDHLDRKSLSAILSRWPHALFAVPEGLQRSLPGAVARRALTLSWWQQFEVRGVTLTLVPAQHWHRRGLFDQDRALWGGWHLGGERSVYHSGDTGYFGGFATITRVLGAPDVAVLPLGAYEPRWFMAMQHMSPEDSVRAWQELGATHFVGMHWGTFDLTDEPMDHGPFVMLPEIVAERELPSDRLHVLPHGGVLGFAQ